MIGSVFAAQGFGATTASLARLLCVTGPQDGRMWEVYTYWLSHKGSSAMIEMLEPYFRDQLLSEWDTIFQSNIAPNVFNFMMGSLYINAFNSDTTIADNYDGGERNMTVPFRSVFTSTNQKSISTLTIDCNNGTVKTLSGTAVIFNLSSVQ
jgi:hypothetical protein